MRDASPRTAGASLGKLFHLSPPRAGRADGRVGSRLASVGASSGGHRSCRDVVCITSPSRHNSRPRRRRCLSDSRPPRYCDSDAPRGTLCVRTPPVRLVEDFLQQNPQQIYSCTTSPQLSTKSYSLLYNKYTTNPQLIEQVDFGLFWFTTAALLRLGGGPLSIRHRRALR